MDRRGVLVDSSLFIEHLRARNKHSTRLHRLAQDAVVETCAIVAAELYYGAREPEMEKQVASALHSIPIHPYTIGLMSAFPSIVGAKRELATLPGEPPDLLRPPSGCRFHPRCPFATEICTQQVPEFNDHGSGHFAACWHPQRSA